MDGARYAVTPAVLPPIPFVGRERELEALLAALERALARQSQTVFLTGETGVGKTRLAHQLADRARARGVAVAEGRAFAVETGLPYAIFADALLPLLRTLDGSALAVLTRGAGSDLAGIFPGLFPASAAHDAEGAAESKARMFWSFTDLLGRLARRQPLLLLLDNLQWADASSIELLHFVARQARGAGQALPLMILGTYADPERDGPAPLRAMEQSLVSLGVGQTVRIAPLSATRTLDLVQRVFGAPAAALRGFAATLHDWTRGNPFFIEESLKSMVESGQLVRRGGVWSGWNVDSLTPPRSVRDVVLERAKRLDEPTRALLDLAAVLGTRLTLDTLRATSGIPDVVLADTLDELRRAAFLVDAADGAVSYDFAHPLVRDTLYAALGPVRAQGMHERIALSLERHYGAEVLTHAAELAHHFSCATAAVANERAARYLVAAGRQALARHADSAAVEYLERALSKGTSADDSELLESLAHARQRVGDFAGAAALWGRVRDVARAAGDASGVAAAERRLGLMASSAGDSVGALVHFDDGLRALASSGVDAELHIRLLLARANALQAVGRRDDALSDARAALEAATVIGGDALLARVHRAMLLLHVWTGPASTAREHGEKAVAHAAASTERTVEWSAHWAMGIHAGLTGDARTTAHHVREAQRLADEVRSPVLRLWTADVAIEYLADIGEWREALALSDQAIAAARTLGQRTLLPRLLIWTGLIHRSLGDLDRAGVFIDEAWALTGSGSDDAARTTDVHAVVPAYMGMAGYRLARGDNAAALAIGEAGLAIADRTGYLAWAIYRLLPFVIESALYLEDYDRAARHNARLRRDSEALGHALGLAWGDTTDALLAYLTGGDPSDAVPKLRRAREALEQVSFVFDAARLRRLVARALADAGDPDGAAAELRRALEIFERLGAEGEVRAAREQLRTIGVRPPARRRSGNDAGPLSARETEIARLVADRKSNKEIGTALDISARTVSTHLSNIFQKLGVSSRGELTDLVRAGGLASGEG